MLFYERAQLGNAANIVELIEPERFGWIVSAFNIIGEKQRDWNLLTN